MSKVLVIADEDIILEHIKFVLNHSGYEVITAQNGDTGIDLFIKHRSDIDVVITDMKMPKLSGIDVLTKIKKISPEIEVIILTGYEDLKDAVYAMKEWACDYLIKPVDPDDLIRALHNAIVKRNLRLENRQMHQNLLAQNSYLQKLNNSAQKILLKLIPKSLPEIKGFHLGVEHKSCEAVGGDMYDFFDMGNYSCFYIFDVSSHGILASVISVILKTFLKNVEYSYKHGIRTNCLSEIVSDLNQELISSTANNVFATLFIGIINKTTKKLYYVSAGHITQYILRGTSLLPLVSTGTVLGAFEDAAYFNTEVNLKKDDKLLLFTDGLIEVIANDKIFGKEKLIPLLKANTHLPLTCLLKKVLETVANYSQDNFVDDVTLLGIEILE